MSVDTGTQAPSPAGTTWKGEGETVTERVTRAVAAAENVEPTDLEPLYDRLDPDALVDLFDSVGRDATRADGHVTFPYGNHQVTVYATGEVVVRD